MQKEPGDYTLIGRLEKVDEVKLIKPVIAGGYEKRYGPPLFTSLEELIALAEKENVDCAEIAIRYEIGRSGWTREELMNHMLKIWSIMKNAASKGLQGDIDPFSWHLHKRMRICSEKGGTEGIILRHIDIGSHRDVHGRFGRRK
jgi:hypothetical protein